MNGYALKLNNGLSTPVEVIDGVNKVMKHLHSRGLLSPCPLVSSTGKDYINLWKRNKLFLVVVKE